MQSRVQTAGFVGLFIGAHKCDLPKKSNLFNGYWMPGSPRYSAGVGTSPQICGREHVGQYAMHPNSLFLIRVRQLGECLERRDAESMLLLSQALRQLLVDGSRLVDVVNREHRVPLEFSVGLSSKEREAEMRALGLPEVILHFLGAIPPNEPRKILKLEQFLKFPVAEFEGEHFSVVTLIKTCANRLGGVHVGEPTSDSAEEANIRRFGEMLSGLGMQHAFSTLILIASVTLAALAPLVSRVTCSQT